MDILKYVAKFEYGEQTLLLTNKTLELIFLEFCVLDRNYVLCRKYHHDTYYAVTHITFDGKVWKIEDDHYYTSMHNFSHQSIINYEYVIIRRSDYTKPSKNLGYI